jgi:hypothetical protein
MVIVASDETGGAVGHIAQYRGENLIKKPDFNAEYRVQKSGFYTYRVNRSLLT